MSLNLTFSGGFESVQVVQDTRVEDGMITRSIKECVNDRVTFLGISAFQECYDLVRVSFPHVTSIRGKAFQACSSLTSVHLPAVNNISMQVFYGCSSLTSVNLPLVTSILDKTFQDCLSLTNVNLPLVTDIGVDAFRDCSSLTIVDLPRVTSIGNRAFQGCSNLTALILRRTVRASLSSPSAFNSTPIASGTGYIYVPAAYVNSYKTAAFWSTYAKQFRAIEDYTVDGTITGELDSTKI